MPNLGIRSYPAVLRKRPKDLLSFKILDTEATVLDDGDFYFIVMKNNKQIVGLVPYESIFQPAIEVPDVLDDDKIRPCISAEQVVEECLPANWRHTAQQQARLAPMIMNSIKRWRELNPPEPLDLEAQREREELLWKIEELQKQLGQLRDLEE